MRAFPPDHRASLRELARRVGGHLKAIFAGATLALIGFVSAFVSFKVPTWSFFAAGGMVVAWGFYQALHDMRLELAALRGDDLRGALHIEPRDAERWGGRSDYVQHIFVRNDGPAGRFRASITTDFEGLEKSYGRSHELVWEHPQQGEKHLGRGQEGPLRFAACRRNDAGRIEIWFFAIPEFRHGDQPSYLETQRYAVVGETVTFELAVRNIERDFIYRHSGHMTFAEDGRPQLGLSEVEDPHGT